MLFFFWFTDSATQQSAEPAQPAYNGGGGAITPSRAWKPSGKKRKGLKEWIAAGAAASAAAAKGPVPAAALVAAKAPAIIVLVDDDEEELIAMLLI